MKKIFKRLLAVITTLLLLAVGSELIALYALGLGSPPLYIVDPAIEYMHAPNQDIMRFHKRQLFNKYGMRSENFPIEKVKGEYRILFFGDSVLNGGNQTDHEELMTTILQKKLSKALQKKITVANISAGSWGPPNMLAYTEKYSLFNADAVYVLLSSHDIFDVPTFDTLNPLTHPTSKPSCALWEGLTRYLPRYAPFLSSILQKQNSHESQLATPTLVDNKKNAEKVLSALTKTHNLASKNNAEFTLILHWERSEILSNSPHDGIDKFRKWAKKHGVPLIDTEKIIKQKLTKEPQIYRSADNIHISPYGQKMYADFLFPLFRQAINNIREQ